MFVASSLLFRLSSLSVLSSIPHRYFNLLSEYFVSQAALIFLFFDCNREGDDGDDAKPTPLISYFCLSLTSLDSRHMSLPIFVHTIRCLTLVPLSFC